MFQRVSWLAYLTALVVLSFPVVARSEIRLQWKFKSGEVLRYGFRQEFRSDTTGAGKPTSMVIEMGMLLSWTVEQVDAQGVATITQVIDKLTLSMKADDLPPIVYDSAGRAPTSGPAKEIAESVGMLAGGKCVVKLNDRGEFVSVEPTEPLRQALAKTKAGNLFTPEGLSRIVRQTSVVLPEKPVAQGARWEATQESPSPLGTLRLVNQYEYAGSEELAGKNCEKIAATTALELLPAKDSQGLAAKVEESSQTGTLWFDATAGRFAKSESRQRLVTQRPYRELTIRVTTTSTMEMKLVE